MSWLWALLAVPAVGAWAWGARVERRARRVWRAAAASLGLEGSTRVLSGDIDGCAVVVRRGEQRGIAGAEVRVRAHAPLSPRLSMGPVGALSAVLKVVAGGGDDVETGDPRFDGAVSVQGDPALALAVLSPATRRLFERLVGLGGVLDAGELRRPVAGDDVVGAVRSLLRAARALRGVEVVAGLAERVAQDPHPAVRRRALKVLIERWPGEAATGAAVEAAAGARDPALRLMVGRHLEGEAGLAVLRGVAGEAGEVGGEALAALVERSSPAAVAPALVELLDGPQAARAATLLGRLGRREAAAALRARVGGADDEAASAMARALGALGDGEAEGALIGLLGRAGARVAAAEALVTVGTPAALAALLPLTEGLSLPGALKQAAGAAVAAIRARRPAGLVGGLALADGGEGGGLAVVEGEGRLAVGRAERMMSSNAEEGS
ncbi:MAG: hypothetical protein R3F65_32090 [bacterium]